MALPYDPSREEGVAIARRVEALVPEPGRIGHCSRCRAHVWINKQTGDFMAKHEVEAICPDCAVKFAKGE